MYRPPFVSEREASHYWPDGRWDDSHWEDCAWCSSLMLANAATKGRFPATLAEAEKARAAVMGPAGGTSISLLATGVAKRWLTFRRLNSDAASFESFWSTLTPGTGAMVMGRLSGLAYGHRLRRWQPDYAGGHAIYVQREAAEDRVWWMDPLGPTTGYAGEYALKGELAAYYNAFAVSGSGSLLGKIEEAEVLNANTQAPGLLVDVAPTNLYDDEAMTIISQGLASWPGAKGVGLYTTALTGQPPLLIRVSPSPGVWKAVYVPFGAISNVRALPAWCPPSGDCTAAVKAATDPLAARIAAAKAALG